MVILGVGTMSLEMEIREWEKIQVSRFLFYKRTSRQVSIHHMDKTGLQSLVHGTHSVLGAPTRAVSVGFLGKICFEDWLQNQFHRCLYDPISDRRHGHR